MKKFSLVILLLITLIFSASSQDMHFSQFYMAPINNNPGNVGAFNGTVRVYNLARMQWFTVTNPYKTFSLSADGEIFRKRMERLHKIDYFSAGFNFNSDFQAGNSRLKTTSYNALVSFTKFLGGRQHHIITLGYEIGYATRSAALGGLTWDRQWDGEAYNAAWSSGEASGASTGFMDMSTGIVWNFRTDHLFRSALGFSMQHFTAPHYSLDGSNDKLYPRLGTQLNMNFKLSETSNTTIEPSILVAQQGPTLLLDIGTGIKYVLNDHSHYTSRNRDEAVHIGIYYRYRDAAFVAFRVDYGAVSGSLAYDINISGLTPVSHSVGSLELAIIYRGIFGHHIESTRVSKVFMN
ncbi:MAG: PorP/SprF family type IX secretion system membrane protein [Bacteroidota bacterium]